MSRLCALRRPFSGPSKSDSPPQPKTHSRVRGRDRGSELGSLPEGLTTNRVADGVSGPAAKTAA
eukprot:2166119-Pyramimonas_sp.AAC.1